MAKAENVRSSRTEQNTSCDACRIRRVKCDLNTLLSASCPDTSPQSCSKCLGKGIKCTTTKMHSVKPPNRTGRRIEQAKAMAAKVDTVTTTAMEGVGQQPAGFSAGPGELMQIWSDPGFDMLPDG